MVSAPDSLVGEMTIIMAVSCHRQQLWITVSQLISTVQLMMSQHIRKVFSVNQPVECYKSCLASAELRQLDNSPSLSMSDRQLDCASLTICSQATQIHCIIVKYKHHNHASAVCTCMHYHIIIYDTLHKAVCSNNCHFT